MLHKIMKRLKRNLMAALANNSIVKNVQQKRILQEWKQNGCPLPPPHIVKQQVIKEFAEKFSMKTFVETGTLLGDMVYAVKDVFKHLFSIELGKDLYENASERFAALNHITIIQGDSGKVMPELLEKLSEPCLFWLDGHYSEGITAKGDKDTPIMHELKHIFAHKIKNHIILIDDARCFVGANDYPALEELKSFVYKNDINWNIEIKDDIIRLYKKQS